MRVIISVSKAPESWNGSRTREFLDSMIQVMNDLTYQHKLQMLSARVDGTFQTDVVSVDEWEMKAVAKGLEKRRRSAYRRLHLRNWKRLPKVTFKIESLDESLEYELQQRKKAKHERIERRAQQAISESDSLGSLGG